MSVIVKGMEMPENCGKCRFAGSCGVHGIEEWPDIESIMFNDIIGIDGSRDEACPLRPLPEKHGRLAEYIEKGALMSLIESEAHRWGDDYDWWQCLADIEDFKPADVRPVVRSHWKKNDNGTYSCERCHSWIPEEQWHYANWCLYCGADMRGDDS